MLFWFRSQHSLFNFPLYPTSAFAFSVMYSPSPLFISSPLPQSAKGLRCFISESDLQTFERFAILLPAIVVEAVLYNERYMKNRTKNKFEILLRELVYVRQPPESRRRMILASSVGRLDWTAKIEASDSDPQGFICSPTFCLVCLRMSSISTFIIFRRVEGRLRGSGLGHAPVWDFNDVESAEFLQDGQRQ